MSRPPVFIRQFYVSSWYDRDLLDPLTQDTERESETTTTVRNCKDLNSYVVRLETEVTVFYRRGHTHRKRHGMISYN